MIREADPEKADFEYEYGDLKMTSLILAAYNEANNIIKALLNIGVNVDAKDANGMTTLMYASANGETEIVQILIDKGASVDFADIYGLTAVLLAASNGYADVVDILAE